MSVSDSLIQCIAIEDNTQLPLNVYFQDVLGGSSLVVRSGNDVHASFWESKTSVELRDYLASLNQQTLAVRLTVDDHESVDVYALLDLFRKGVIEKRRSNTYSESLAREHFDAIDGFYDDLCDDGMIWVKYNVSAMQEYMGSDWVNLIPMKPSKSYAVALRRAKAIQSALRQIAS